MNLFVAVTSLPSSKLCSSGKKKGRNSDKFTVDASMAAINEVNQQIKSTDSQLLAILESKKELSEEDKFGNIITVENDIALKVGCVAYVFYYVI